MKIKELTNEQMNLLNEYATKGIELGLCCEPIDEAAAIDYGKRIMKWLERDYHGTIILDSPFAVCCAIEGRMLDKRYPRQSWEHVEDLSYYYVMAQARLEVKERIETHILDLTRVYRRNRRYLQDPVEHECNFLIWDCVREQMQSDQVWSQFLELYDESVVKETVKRIWLHIERRVVQQGRNHVQDRIMAHFGTMWPYLCGQWYSYYVAWHHYVRNVIRLDLPDIWQIEEQTKFGGVYPLSKIVIISRRPKFIHQNSSGHLHCDGGPAICYADGFSVFALNGIRVPEWLAVEGESEIDPRKFTSIENVDIRREFIRKVGIERISVTCGATSLDKRGNYELLSINLGGRTGEWPFLKMLNPSIGVWHLEAVAKEIITVDQALKWRNQSDLVPEQLT